MTSSPAPLCHRQSTSCRYAPLYKGGASSAGAGSRLVPIGAEEPVGSTFTHESSCFGSHLPMLPMAHRQVLFAVDLPMAYRQVETPIRKQTKGTP